MLKSSFFRSLSLSMAVAACIFYASCVPKNGETAAQNTPSAQSPAPATPAAQKMQALQPLLTKNSEALWQRAEQLASNTNSLQALDLLLAAERLSPRLSAEELRSIYETAANSAPTPAKALLPPASAIAFDAADRASLLAMLRLQLAAAAYASSYAASNEEALIASFSPLPFGVQPMQSSAQVGKPYELRMMLGQPMQSSAQVGFNVNGMELRTEQGIAEWRTQAPAAGTQTYEATARIQNPMTGETINTKETFSYLVAPSKPAASGSATLKYDGMPAALLAHCANQQKIISRLQTQAQKAPEEQRKKAEHEHFLKNSPAVWSAYENFVKASSAWGQNLPDEAQYKAWQQADENLQKALQQSLAALADGNLASDWEALKNTAKALSPLSDFAALAAGDKNENLTTLLLAQSERLSLIENYYSVYLENIFRLELRYDRFRLFNQPKSPTVNAGEEFSTRLQLMAFTSQAKFSVSVDGKALPIVDGIATYQMTPTAASPQSLTIEIKLKNPLTGKTYSATKKVLIPVAP